MDFSVRLPKEVQIQSSLLPVAIDRGNLRFIEQSFNDLAVTNYVTPYSLKVKHEMGSVSVHINFPK